MTILAPYRRKRNLADIFGNPSNDTAISWKIVIWKKIIKLEVLVKKKQLFLFHLAIFSLEPSPSKFLYHFILNLKLNTISHIKYPTKYSNHPLIHLISSLLDFFSRIRSICSHNPFKSDHVHNVDYKTEHVTSFQLPAILPIRMHRICVYK